MPAALGRRVALSVLGRLGQVSANRSANTLLLDAQLLVVSIQHGRGFEPRNFYRTDLLHDAYCGQIHAALQDLPQ